MSTGEEAHRLIKLVAKHFRMTDRELMAKCRDHRTIRARAAAVKILRDVMLLSYPKLGLVFKQNHATCLNSYRNAKNWLETDRFFRRHYLELEEDLRKQGEL